MGSRLRLSEEGEQLSQSLDILDFFFVPEDVDVSGGKCMSIEPDCDRPRSL